MMMMMAKPRTDLPASPGATCVIDCLRGVWIGPDQTQVSTSYMAYPHNQL